MADAGGVGEADAAAAEAAAPIPVLAKVPGGAVPPAPAVAPPPPPLQLQQAVPGPPGAKRKRGGAHPLWRRMRALPAADYPDTHECLSCQARIHCPKNGKSFVNTPVRRHFEQKHAAELQGGAAVGGVVGGVGKLVYMFTMV
jgi:hypothetical protein